MRHVSAPAAANVGGRSYTSVKANLTANKTCDKDPTLCSCAERIEHGPAKKLLHIFRVLPATKPIHYVQVLQKLGGRKAMDQLYREIGLSDRSQMIQCVKAWRASGGRLEMAGEVLQVAISNSEKKCCLL